ncbi:MAG TPA: hypothetical protein VFX22_00290, partial [Candidatus Kapabacteria bacterium]|nr:hypothetical protein [Candidatus Kapabacteria bacterium]
NTQLPANIILHYTNVYYCPMTPPGPNDVRALLSNVSDILRDPNGAGDYWRNYLPFTRDSILSNTHPCGGAPLGRSMMWQRFFTARDKWSGSHSDIIAGGYRYDSVIISKNEDVDFRASGTVKLENGFHAEPGCFFHAYQEPRWGPTVFKDEFDSTALDKSQWMVREGSGEGSECSTDRNVFIDTDYQATDGHALDVVLREVPDTCSCIPLVSFEGDTGCMSVPDLNDTIPFKYIFSSANLIACPWPYNQSDSPRVAAYVHAPYGKYEVREKIPHILHHTNNWGSADRFEYDLNESWSSGEIHPAFGAGFTYGPYNGVFRESGDTVYFVSPAFASWRWVWPLTIVIDHILYDVTPVGTGYTVIAGAATQHRGGFPTSLSSRTDSVQFYYQIWPYQSADNVTWHVDSDAVTHQWDKFSAPYRILAPGDSLRFTKAYQPVRVTLTIDTTFGLNRQITLVCRWDSALNSNASDTGYLRLYTPLANTDLHSNTEPYGFTVPDRDEGNGYGYNYTETPPVYMDYATGKALDQGLPGSIVDSLWLL